MTMFNQLRLIITYIFIVSFTIHCANHSTPKSNDVIQAENRAQSNIDIDKVKTQVEHRLEEAGVLERSKVEILPSNPGQTVKETVREFLVSSVEQDYIDVVFVGNKGADFSARNTEKYLGSVANEIIGHTKINCCFFT